MKKKHIAIVCTIAVLWLGAIGFVLIKNKDKLSTSKNDEKIERYVVPTAKKIFLDGAVEPIKSKSIYKDVVKGENYTVHKDKGDSVRKGNLLITYKNEEVSDQIKDLRDDIKDLQKKSKTSDSVEAMTAKDQVKDMKRQLARLEDKQHSYVYAPFSGIVSKLNNDTSEENQEILKLRSTEFCIKSQISEKELDEIEENQEVEVLILANDKKTKGIIDEIAYEPEAVNMQMEADASMSSSISNYPVKISLNSQEGIINGYHVQIKIQLSDEKIKIPKTAVKEEKGKSYVYLIKDSKLVKKFIEVNETIKNSVVVQSGLNEKDELVKVINSDMKEGQEVE